MEGTVEDSRLTSELIRSIRRMNLLRTEKRRYPRRNCFIKVNYVVLGRSYNDVVSNISQGGACVRAQRPFFPGDGISADFCLLGLRAHVEGRIAWVSPRSIGIEFRSLVAHPKEARYGIGSKAKNQINTEKGGSGMGKVRRKKVRWEPSAEAAKYRLYWSVQGPVGYESDFVEIENKTLVVLPDEIPSFPKIAGEIELGITAVSVGENESDITRLRVYLDFTVPEAPKALTEED